MPASLFYRATLSTPIGELEFATDTDTALVALAFTDSGNLARLCGPAATFGPDASRTHPVREALSAYFAGTRRHFLMAVAPRIGTPFQRRVWSTLTHIPWGATWSYARLAAEVGSAARAVGSAAGANPICIVVPCHRVLGADGSLTGYAGGLDRKRWLLAHEGAAFC